MYLKFLCYVLYLAFHCAELGADWPLTWLSFSAVTLLVGSSQPGAIGPRRGRPSVL